VADGKAGNVVAFETLKVETGASRRSSGHDDLDRVLVGGLVPGSVTLLGGEPGIGKSTLLAQVAVALTKKGTRVMYVTGEESPSQVALRLRRVEATIPATLTFLDATDASVVAATIRDEKPDLTIVDSIQAMRLAEVTGGAGNVTQMKASAAIITEAAKAANVPVILAGQVTKDGDLAGPRTLEHLVDTVLMLEGDQNHRFRLLRALKHRFGPTDEVAVLAMTERGLTSVDDPSAELLRERPSHVPGSIVTCLIEGHRPILFEIQALVSHAGYGTPVRRATGVDTTRLGLLIAVLARRASVQVLDKDVYANAAGGLDARDPSVDLALCLAIASAVSDLPVDPKTVACGEVGLGGEIRPIPFSDLRAKEAQRHGFTTIILPRNANLKPIPGMRVIEVGTLREAINKTLSKA
jgi:DNA repair protein RadA/Sms